MILMLNKIGCMVTLLTKLTADLTEGIKFICHRAISLIAYITARMRRIRIHLNIKW